MQVDLFIITLALKSVAERKSFLIRCLITIGFSHRFLMPSGYLYLYAVLKCNCHEVLSHQNDFWIALSRDGLWTGSERENKIFLFYFSVLQLFVNTLPSINLCRMQEPASLINKRQATNVKWRQKCFINVLDKYNDINLATINLHSLVPVSE